LKKKPLEKSHLTFAFYILIQVNSFRHAIQTMIFHFLSMRHNLGSKRPKEIDKTGCGCVQQLWTKARAKILA